MWRVEIFVQFSLHLWPSLALHETVNSCLRWRRAMSPPMDSKMNLLERVNCELILGRMNVSVVISDRTIVERFFDIVLSYCIKLLVNYLFLRIYCLYFSLIAQFFQLTMKQSSQIFCFCDYWKYPRVGNKIFTRQYTFLFIPDILTNRDSLPRIRVTKEYSSSWIN